MDLKDRKLLLELDKDSRCSIKQLGKRTGMKQETVRYRLNKLVDEGIIKQFLGIVNGAALGFTYYQMFIKLQDLKETTKQETIKLLQQNDRVNWIGNLAGNYDIAFIIGIKNNQELTLFLEQFRNGIGKNVMRKTISVHVNSTFYNRDYLINKERIASRQKSIMYEKQEIDVVNKKICELYCRNARITAVELGKKLSLSPDAIIQRIKKLKEKKILQGGTTIINLNKIGMTQHKILFYLKNTDTIKLEKIKQFAETNNRVIAIINTMSEWDIEIDLEVENTEQLNNFISEITNKFSESIRDYQTVQIIDVPKYTFVP